MRIVVKIGTSSVTDERGTIARKAIKKVVDEIAARRAAGHEVLLVSSGAVAAGLAALGFEHRPTDTLTLQAVSAVGQSRLMQVYNDRLAMHDTVGAQVLIDPYDFVDRTQYLHARVTLERLLELGCLPIVNENDAIANDGMRYGDNDRVAALMAHSLRADLLVLLTDADGLYTADPRTEPSATLIERVAADDPLLAIDVSPSGTARGSGGMASKLAAARIASWSGVETVIARADRADVLAAATDGLAGGTRFEAHDRRMSAKKLWIAFAAEVRGRIVVDAGAQRALTVGSRSLLPAGVRSAQGRFEAGQTVDVATDDGVVFARGVAGCSSVDLAAVVGRQTSELPDHMVDEVIHRDDLVVLPSS